MASVTGTYARAFADVVIEERLDADKTVQQARQLVQLVAGSKELREVWETPSISAEQKRAVLDAVVKRAGISKSVRNFLAVLIDHRRISFLEPIVKQFEHELNQRLGFVEAEISSARELSEKERHALETRMEKVTGKKLRPQYFRDESILGGAIVKVGSTIYDGSVAGQLEEIRERLRN
jgi:F-type H+-transporting ATPase subunit delta